VMISVRDIYLSEPASALPVILPQLHETIFEDLLQGLPILKSGSKHGAADLLLVKKPRNQVFQSRFALRQAYF
jgi:hypothetical protein